MPIWRLLRIKAKKTEHGTPGKFNLDGSFFCYTMEPPDKNNEPQVSCIPTGIYICKLITSPHFGKVYQLMDVPNRDHILIHKGNAAFLDSKGCILLGSTLGTFKGYPAVLDSHSAFDRFMLKNQGYDEITITISEV